jgi:predicted acetyltransferase
MQLRHLETSGPRPTSTYESVIDGKKVGKIQLRHTPGKSEASPEGFESHIYYEIDSEFQGKGFAKEQLKLVLDEARKINLKEVILTVAENNLASQKVVEATGGELLDSKSDTDGLVHRKYKIAL